MSDDTARLINKLDHVSGLVQRAINEDADLRAQLAAAQAELAIKEHDNDDLMAEAKALREQLAAAVGAMGAYQAYVDHLVLSYKPSGPDKVEALRLWGDVERLTVALASAADGQQAVKGGG